MQSFKNIDLEIHWVILSDSACVFNYYNSNYERPADSEAKQNSHTSFWNGFRRYFTTLSYVEFRFKKKKAGAGSVLTPVPFFKK